MKGKIKKHIVIASIIWLFIAIFVVAITGFKNIIWAILLGLIYIGYYILTTLGLNPVVEGSKIIWRGGKKEDDGRGDYGMTKEEINNYNKDKKDSEQ